MAVSSSVAPALRAAASQAAAKTGSGGKGRPSTTWEGVLKAAEAEPEKEKAATARAIAELRTAREATTAEQQQQQAVSIKPPPPAAVPPPDPAVVASASRPRFCCFDPQDALLSVVASAAQSGAAVKQKNLAVLAEAVFADP